MTLSLNSIDIPHVEPDSPPLFADLTAGIEPFITEDELQSRVGELAWEIAEDYRKLGVSPDNPLHLIGLLKGVVPFMADPIGAIPPEHAQRKPRPDEYGTTALDVAHRCDQPATS